MLNVIGRFNSPQAILLRLLPGVSKMADNISLLQSGKPPF